MGNQQEKIEYDQVEQIRVAHEQLEIILQPAEFKKEKNSSC